MNSGDGNEFSTAKVKITGNLLISSAGKKVDEAIVKTPALLREILNELQTKYDLQLRRDSMLILVNGIEANVLEDLDTVVKADDQIVLIPMFHGGTS